MKISVIGSGNGGLTSAYHLAKMGNEICLYDDINFDTQIKAVDLKGGITALSSANDEQMILSGFESISISTTDPKIASDFSDILVMICPSFAQEVLFLKLLPHLRSDQMIILMPGNYGSLALTKIKNESGYENLDLIFVDAISIPWATRISGLAEISIMGLKEFLPVSIYPLKYNNDYIKNIVSSVLPIKTEFLEHPIVAGLENINFGGHPLMTICNIGLLENFNGEFNYYGECSSKSTANAQLKMDSERISIANALDFTVKDELTAMNALYNTEYKSVLEFNQASKTHGKIKNAPNSSSHRYITEDVPYLLVPCHDLGKLLGVKTPIITSLIHLANAYLDENFFESGRTLKKMGINSIEDIKKQTV